MNYIDTRDGRYPLTSIQIVAENPLTSFTHPFEPCDHYAGVIAVAAPAFNPATHKPTEAAPVLTGEDWMQAWTVSAMTTGELAARAAELAAQLTVAKVAKNLEINAARLTANRDSFTHGGKAIACDELSRSDIDAANGFVSLYDVLPPGWPGGWKAIDNSYIEITTVAQWKSFFTSMFAQGSTNFAHAQALKTALAAATTLAQVEAITW